ncbi:MAG: pimeloyl-ACP methyl ester carboxylesterase [Candidatus Poriferisodalaceae bacterium]|jgi:pimeloyl-ACP methyl ester carboxylesterase
MNERLNAVIHDGVGPHALMVHGALCSRSYWTANLEALQEVCRPVVVELWGHGQSPSPADPDSYSPASYAAQFELIRTELDVDDWFTIGQSMGAALTLRYGLTHPDRVRAQIITNSSSAFADPKVWRERNRTTIAKIASEVEARGMEALRESWINPGRSDKVVQPTRDQLIAEFAEHTAAGVIGGLQHTNKACPLGERLAEVSRPTLLTNGIEETRFQARLPAARQIPEIEIVEIDASHAVNAQNPEQWNAAAIPFLQRHST